MAGEWIECALVDVCSSIDYGFTASATDFNVGPRFLRITDIVSDHIDWNNVPHVLANTKTIEKYRLSAGDIVLARTGASTGVSAYVKNPPLAVFASYLVRLKVKPEFDPRFVAYYLKSVYFWTFIRGVLGDKSAQPNASASTMAKAPFRAPKNKGEQRRIAHILGTLDDKIELNRKMNRTLEAIARAIFKSWFVDFDPVIDNALDAGKPMPEEFAERAARRAKLTHGKSPLPENIRRLFPDEFQDSELGPIPRGWEVKPIGNLVKCVGGATPSTRNPEYWEGGTNPFLTPRDMASLDAPVVLDTERHITDAGVDRISSKKLPVGTVFLSSRAPIGYLATNEVPVSINQGVIAMICDGEIPNYYTFLWVKNNMNVIKGKAGGTTFAEISKKNFRSIPALRPSDAILDKFANMARSFYKQIVENAVSSVTLAKLRDTLLPKLISGELRVPDVEKLVEGTV